MKKVTMLTYLDEQLTKKLPDFDSALDWDRRNHSIEVIVRLFAENKTGAAIDDAEGVVSEEEIIEFEDGILFYNPEKTKLDPADYLAVIPYEGKKGVKKAVLDAFIIYLEVVLTEGQSDLLDFLTDEAAETFELKWSDEAFAAQLAATQQTTVDQDIIYPTY